MLHLSYPVHLGIAYIFLVGYLVRTLFVSLRLPASVGVLISGFAFAQFFQDDLENARASLQEIAFFTVLLEAGLDLTLQDLQPPIFVMAWLPWTCELLAIAGYGVFSLDFTKREALVLGTILSTLGPGLVMPKMKEFGTLCKRHPLPRLLFTWAPLEGSIALIFFGFMLGLVSPQPFVASRISTLLVLNILRIVATVGAGALVGGVSGWLISRRMLLRFRGQPFFSGLPVETFLMTLAAALIAFSLGASYHGRVFVPWPMALVPGSLFQSEPLVVAMGTTFAMTADHTALQEVKSILGGVWVFGQLILFSMIGSGADVSILREARGVLPIMGLGLLARFVGVLVAVYGTRDSRGCASQSRWSTMKDASFCFLATMPRATVQAALGAVPMTERFFHGDPDRAQVGLFIFTAARVYIVVMSVVGQTLLNTLGPLLLDITTERPEEEFCKGVPEVPPEVAKDDVSSLASESTMASAYSISSTPSEQQAALHALAWKHGISSKVLKVMLMEEAAEITPGSSPSSREREKKLPPLPHFKGHVLPTLDEGRVPRPRRAFSNDDLLLSQFDSMGSVYNDGRLAWGKRRASS